MNEKNHSLICELRHQLHRHPELSLEECWAQQHLMAFLKAHTHLEVVPRGKWFYAKYASGSDLPGVLFRAELDALPVEDAIEAAYASEIAGHGHKCGHDGHMASLCGLALELEERVPTGMCIWFSSTVKRSAPAVRNVRS